jgi:L-ascorbate metabolism protein UlaG (beta-lactamase superfamily)
MNNVILKISLIGICSVSLVFLAGSVIAAEDAPSADEEEAKTLEKDVIKTETGDLTITFIGHGTLMFQYAGKIIHLDPWTRLADYSELPDADLILITHEHGDHLDPEAVDEIRKEATVICVPANCKDRISGSQVAANGQTIEVIGLKIEVVPAYNIKHMRNSGQPYHPKGQGNGYVITFGDKRVYIAGDTENTPEMKSLRKIDIAFLPMNLPYTMTPEMVADAAKAFKPKILYPYHYGQTDVNTLTELLADEKDIDVRIRKMQ